jgi:hypothetical protein
MTKKSNSTNLPKPHFKDSDADSSAQFIKAVKTEKPILTDQASTFFEIRQKDYDWKLTARKTYGKILLILLILQNIAVFGLVFWAFISGKMKDLQLIFSILVPATLGETAFMVKTIVEWLFKDINYPE